MRRRNSGQDAESRANCTRDPGNSAFLSAGRGVESVLKDLMNFEKYAVPAAPRAYACVFSQSANYLPGAAATDHFYNFSLQLARPWPDFRHFAAGSGGDGLR